MQYLRKAGAEVTAESGIWRLWETPKDVPRASQAQSDEMQVDHEELKRIKGNLDDALENRVDGKDNPLDRSLSPSRSTRRRSKDERRSKDQRRDKGVSV